ncbi:hypothetical protein L1987_70998 [Smallanthus sonchifolius]|uniref:Uncharacterized protein n=1 Tax=Smallanthus sonchifolius TaxID=185202 RepID=A0ACB9AQL1_9ASTR|nr:hypothetical protein L1987_70998 [Smallanthus sonchifolius]
MKIQEKNDESSTKVEEQELALSKAVEAMESNIGTSPEYFQWKKRIALRIRQENRSTFVSAIFCVLVGPGSCVR